MATYNITSQTDLEEMGSKGLTAANTFILQNDITVSNWTRIGKPWAGATLDGNGYKISGITTHATPFIQASNLNHTSSFTSTNFGKTHTISFRWGGNTGTGQYVMFGGAFGNNAICINSFGQLWYYAGGGWGVYWYIGARPTTAVTITIVRSGTSVTMYYGENSGGAKTLGSNVDFTADSMLRHYTGTWTGEVSEVVVTSDAKDQAWVTAQNNGNQSQGLGRYTTTTNTSNITNLWHLDEGTGTTATDSIGGKNLSGIDGWNTPVYKGGFIEEMSSGTIKNLTIDTPSIVWNLNDSVNSNNYLGGIVNNVSNTSTISACEVIGGTLSAVNVKYINMGGISGNGNNIIVNDCISSVDNFVWTSLGLHYSPQVGGLVGRPYSATITNSQFTGGGTAAPNCGVGMYNTTGNRYYRNIVTGVTASRRICGYDGGGFTGGDTNYYLDQAGQQADGWSIHATKIDSGISYFYDITNAPMASWDFGVNGYWSKRNDTTDLPPLNGRFLADISGTIGTLDAKTMKLSIREGTPLEATTSSGAFTFSAVSGIENSAMTFWLDGDTAKSTMIGVLPFGTTDITGLTMYEGRLGIGDESGDLGTYFKVIDFEKFDYVDGDVSFTYQPSSFTTRNSCKLFIPTGNTFEGETSLTYNNLVSGIINDGTYIDGYATVMFGDFTLEGDITFTQIQTAGPITITFEAGKTYTSGVFPSGCTYRSSSTGNRFTLSPTADITISGVDVQDSECSDYSIRADLSTNSGNTDFREASPHWIFSKSQNAFVLESN